MKKTKKFLFYCWPTMFIQQPGLGHMKEIARTLMLDSYLNNRIALLPPLLSNYEHNPNFKKNLNWEDYYDWSELSVNDPKLINRSELRDFIEGFSSKQILQETENSNFTTSKEDLVIKFFSDPNIFGEWIDNRILLEPNQLKEPLFSDHYPQQIWKAASDVIDEIGIPRGVIHIRRGDLASPETDTLAVGNYLKNKGVKDNDPIFVITNEKNPSYYNNLRACFPRIIFEGEVNALKCSDNYKIFRVGKCIQSRFDKLDLGTLRFMKSIPERKKSIVDRIFAKISFANRIVSLKWLEKI